MSVKQDLEFFLKSEEERRAKEKKKRSTCFIVGIVMALGGIIAISESGSAFISSD